MSHTPGPWRVHYGNFIAGGKCLWVDSLVHQNNPSFEKFYRVHSGNPVTDEQIANARLIAAAPELLAALEECITEEASASWCTFTNAKRRLSYISDLAKTAIKKAREG